MTNFDFNTMAAKMNASFEANVAAMKARHNAGVAEMYAEADRVRQEMASERAALDAKFQEHLDALEEQKVAATVDHLVTNICMLLNTTRRF